MTVNNCNHLLTASGGSLDRGGIRMIGSRIGVYWRQIIIETWGSNRAGWGITRVGGSLERGNLTEKGLIREESSLERKAY